MLLLLLLSQKVPNSTFASVSSSTVASSAILRLLPKAFIKAFSFGLAINGRSEGNVHSEIVL